ncbi:hypothetical protein [Aestuariivirga litoralis]|uniref:hypothetical protein n=1 Tax=Aestuariivirga litoralis TaxID=2650924 RepID=UPI003D7C1BAB
MVFYDSDTFFVKPFDVRELCRRNRVRFGWQDLTDTSDGQISGEGTMVDDSIRKLISSSTELLGLSPDQVKKRSLQDPMMAWHRDTAVAMQE